MVYVCVNPSLAGVFVEKLKKAPSLRTSAPFTKYNPNENSDVIYMVRADIYLGAIRCVDS